MKVLFSLLSLSLCAVMLSFCISAFYAYNYPMKYQDEIRAYSQEFEIEGAIIASVANVESNFKEDAQSSKGAVGIMQLMPSTAEWIAGEIKEEYSQEKLEQPSFNLKLGSYYLSYLIKYFNDIKLGICAYNAGQGNVRQWLKNSEYSKDGKTLDKIPFKETKSYVEKFTKNYKYYKNKYK